MSPTLRSVPVECRGAEVKELENRLDRGVVGQQAKLGASCDFFSDCRRPNRRRPNKKQLRRPIDGLAVEVDGDEERRKRVPVFPPRVRAYPR